MHRLCPSQAQERSPGKDGFNPDPIQLPCQRLSVDFAFTGPLCEDKSQRQDVEGVNGKTCWQMIQDKFDKMVHCDAWISKAPPVQFTDDFLTTHAPVEATQKCVMPDQGGELCRSPQMSKVFKKHGCKVLPTVLPNHLQRSQSDDDWGQPTNQIVPTVSHMPSAFSIPHHLQARLPARLNHD